MTIRIFGIAGSSNSAEDFRLAASGLFVPASALNNRSGVTSVPVLTGTGNLTATVGAFSCLIDGTSNSLQGSYWVTNDAPATVTIGNGSSQARIDLISMQILDNAYDGSGQQKAQLVVTPGTPSGSPVAPATPANAIPLWTVPVAALATSVTWASATAVFPYTAANGGVIPVRNAADKPAVANGLGLRFRLDVGAGGASPLEWSTDGGATYTPTFDPTASSPWSAWTNLTPAANFSTSTQPRYRTAPGGLVQLGGSVQYTGVTGSLSGANVFGSGLPNCTGAKAMLPVIQFGITLYQGYVVASGTGLGIDSPNIANNAFVNLDNLIYQTG